MIERVRIANWQSLRDLDLPVGRFTVIVGPSSSGKTAFMRAMRAVASNVRGTANITRGAKSFTITVDNGEHTVALHRTEATGSYRITGPDGDQTYTKLAGAVPDAVTRALRIEPVTGPTGSLNFAGQFDRPYLLDESGAAVARVLGELTNVSTIFAAVREGNRRRAGYASTLKTRENDLADLIAQSRTYAGLPVRLAACESAEKVAETAAALQDRVHRLRSLTQALIVADGVLARAAELPEPPTDTVVTAAAARLATFRRLLTEISAANQAVTKASYDAEQWASAEAGLHEQVHRALVAAGTCPTCGQPVTDQQP